MRKNADEKSWGKSVKSKSVRGVCEVGTLRCGVVEMDIEPLVGACGKGLGVWGGD